MRGFLGRYAGDTPKRRCTVAQNQRVQSKRQETGQNDAEGIRKSGRATHRKKKKNKTRRNGETGVRTEFDDDAKLV